MNYSYTRHNGSESLVIVTPTGPLTVAGSHPKFAELRTYLSNTPEPDEEYVRSLVDYAAEVRDRLRRLSERVTYHHGSIYFDGDRIDNSLTRHIVRMLRADDRDYERFVRFLENLALNPSRMSRLHLFRWLEDRDFAITPEGHFVGYKGVQGGDGNYSVHSGDATVNGERRTGHIPNPLGGVVEMPRHGVNPDRGEGCSTGLHVGTWEYANGFSRKTLTVAVNPRDVVAVPRDCESQKLRCCRYTVLDVTRAQFEGTSYDEEPEDDFYDDEEEEDIFV